MALFGSIYSGLSGLTSYSKGLDIISNNVANLNTIGFKSSQLQFVDLVYQFRLAGDNDGNRSSLQVGEGVNTTSTKINFRAGDFRDSGNDLDAAINGNGFFILRDEDGNTFYTRSGQFEIDNDGFLVDSTSKARVAGISGSSGLQDIDISTLRTNPPQPTTSVTFADNLSTGGTTHTINNATVFDSTGASHDLTLIFTNNSAVTAGSWLVQVDDSTGTTLANGEIRFQGNGSPLTGFNTFTFSFAPGGVPATNITFDFGQPGSFTGATSFSGGTTSTLRVLSQNGFSVGSLTKTEFNQDGVLVLSYSNGQTVNGDRLALAWFDNLQNLELRGGSLFVNNTEDIARIAAANSDVMGFIEGGRIELSNVELTSEFTDMVIVQRGFQASSQIISISNEMIQQLFDIRGRS